MAVGDLFLVSAAAVALAAPGEWLVPTPEQLEAAGSARCQVKVRVAEIGPNGGADLWDSAAVWCHVTSREASELVTTVLRSEVAADGYRPGETLRVGIDEVFDVVLVDDDGRPVLNEERLQAMGGRTVLVGITEVSDDGEVVDRQQFAGVLRGVGDDGWITLELLDGTLASLPPDTRPFEEARPGRYELSTTGQVVDDPDFLCSWTLRAARDDERPEAPPGA